MELNHIFIYMFLHDEDMFCLFTDCLPILSKPIGRPSNTFYILQRGVQWEAGAVDWGSII